MDKLDKKICEALDRQSEALDAETASRLNRARQAALAQLDAPNRRLAGWFDRIPLGAALSGAMATAILITLVLPGDEQSGPSMVEVAAAQVDDWEMLTESTELALLDELDFYLWVGAQLATVEDDPLG